MRHGSIRRSTNRYLAGFLWLAIGLALLPVVSIIYSIIPDGGSGSTVQGRTIRIELYSVQTPDPSWFPMNSSFITLNYSQNIIEIYDRGKFVARWSISGSTLELFIARPYQDPNTRITNGTWSYVRSSASGSSNNYYGFSCDSVTGRCESYTWSVPANFTFVADTIVVSFLAGSLNTTTVFTVSSNNSTGTTNTLQQATRSMMGLVLFGVPVIFFVQAIRRLLWTRI